MKKRFTRNVGLPAVLTVLLGGCLADGAGPRQTLGALGGAVGGAFVGNEIGKGSGRVLATAAGTLVGLGVGADVGRSLDRANRVYEARLRERRGHSQQTPVPGFAPAPAAGGSWSGGAHDANEGAWRSGSVRDARDCRSLQGGLKPVFACRNGAGQWFVLQ